MVRLCWVRAGLGQRGGYWLASWRSPTPQCLLSVSLSESHPVDLSVSLPDYMSVCLSLCVCVSLSLCFRRSVASCFPMALPGHNTMPVFVFADGVHIPRGNSRATTSAGRIART